MYHCGRTYIVEKNGWDNPKDNEMIDFNTKYSKESIINKILLCNIIDIYITENVFKEVELSEV